MITVVFFVENDRGFCRMKQKKKAFQVLAMQIRTPKLNLISRDLEINRFDLDNVEEFFRFIVALPHDLRNQDLGERFIFLEKFDDDYNNNYYSGWFISARYGEIPDWIDAHTAVRRPSGKYRSEGEENRTYFVLEKTTGLFLLQSDNKRIATGSTVDDYFNSKKDGFEPSIDKYNKRNQGRILINKDVFIQFDYSISTAFMEEVRRLSRIKKTTFQADVISSGGNNVVEAISKTLEGVENYDSVEYSVIIKERGRGIRQIEKFIDTLQEQHQFRNVIVAGTTSLGRPKVISWEKHARRYEINVDINVNGLPGQDDVINKLIELARKENPLGRKK